jgi:predicted metal-dependent hydrolase
MTQRTALRRAVVEPGEELLRFAGFDATVRWRRSTRARRVSLRIDTRSGAVVVTLPLRASRQTGMALLREHSVWLMGRIAALPRAIMLDAGASVPLCGVSHTVRHLPAGRGGAWVDDGEIVVSGGAEFIARRIIDFLRAEARRRLTALVAEISTDTIVARRISIKDTHTRWGSCTATGTLMFNWRLVMAPVEVQHYVVAHEMAHLKFMDHGPAFWALVRRLTTHEAFAEDWLRRHGASLLRVG